MNTPTVYKPSETFSSATLFYVQSSEKSVYRSKRFYSYGVPLTIKFIKGTTPREEREKLLQFFKSKNVKIDQEDLFRKLLEKLNSEEIRLIERIATELINGKYNFHIEVYETDGDLENLYFIIHFPEEKPYEQVEEELFQIDEFKRKIDKNKILWFINFATEITDV